MLHFYHYFFLIFHTVLILFNLFGWVWKPLRKAHLTVVLLTIGSWTLLGIWYGFGYCPLTDLHWDILGKMGVTDLPNSYLKYLLDTLTGLEWNAGWVDRLALAGIVFGLFMSIRVNFLSKKRKQTSL